MRPKRKNFEALLIRYPSFFIAANVKYPGIVVPDGYDQEGVIVLQFGVDLRYLAVPIKNLTISDWGVAATLSFDQKPFDCKIPWDAMLSMWPEASTQPLEGNAPGQQGLGIYEGGRKVGDVVSSGGQPKLKLVVNGNGNNSDHE